MSVSNDEEKRDNKFNINFEGLTGRITNYQLIRNIKLIFNLVSFKSYLYDGFYLIFQINIINTNSKWIFDLK